MKWFLGLLVGILLLGAVAVGAAARSVGPPNLALAFQDATNGEAVFQANCAACHQVGGTGIPGAFPPLAGNPSAAEGTYVESVIRGGLTGSIEVLGTTYNGVMPPVTLSDSDIADVVAYVGTLADGSEPPPTTITPTGTGDHETGRRLFKGSVTLANGGPACQACHSAGSIDFRGGSGLGPDLTNVYDRLGGDAGLTAWLSAPASQTMRPLFTDRPLTEGEIADITSFFALVTAEAPSGGIDQVLVGGGVGLIVLLGLMALLIRGPNETYTERLRRKP